MISSRGLEVLAKINACNARVAAMQAVNAVWFARGLEPAHVDIDFSIEADRLESLAQEAWQLSNEERS